MTTKSDIRLGLKVGQACHDNTFPSGFIQLPTLTFLQRAVQNSPSLGELSLPIQGQDYNRDVLTYASTRKKKGKLGFLSFSHFFAAVNFFQLIIFHDSRCRDLNGLAKGSIFNLAVLSWLQFL